MLELKSDFCVVPGEGVGRWEEGGRGAGGRNRGKRSALLLLLLPFHWTLRPCIQPHKLSQDRFHLLSKGRDSGKRGGRTRVGGRLALPSLELPRLLDSRISSVLHWTHISEPLYALDER